MFLKHRNFVRLSVEINYNGHNETEHCLELPKFACLYTISTTAHYIMFCVIFS